MAKRDQSGAVMKVWFFCSTGNAASRLRRDSFEHWEQQLLRLYPVSSRPMTSRLSKPRSAERAPCVHRRFTR